MVSVLLPAFKAKYLSEAIMSVLSQTHEDFELIIVNDKSPEDLTSIVSLFDDYRIRYFINEENIGAKDLVANWNYCLSLARGEYFCLICDDDVYEPTFIEEMLSLANQYPHCNVFRSGVSIIDKNAKVYDYYPSSPSWESSEDYIWHVLRGYRCQTITEWFYRRDPILHQGGFVSFPLAWYSDFISIFKFSTEGGIASTAKRLVTFRMSGDNITSKHNMHTLKKMEAACLFENELADMIISNKYDKDILLSLLRKYMFKKKTYELGTCSFSDLIRLYHSRKEYGLSHLMFLKSLKQRLR